MRRSPLFPALLLPGLLAASDLTIPAPGRVRDLSAAPGPLSGSAGPVPAGHLLAKFSVPIGPELQAALRRSGWILQTVLSSDSAVLLARPGQPPGPAEVAWAGPLEPADKAPPELLESAGTRFRSEFRFSDIPVRRPRSSRRGPAPPAWPCSARGIRRSGRGSSSRRAGRAAACFGSWPGTPSSRRSLGRRPDSRTTARSARFNRECRSARRRFSRTGFSARPRRSDISTRGWTSIRATSRTRRILSPSTPILPGSTGSRPARSTERSRPTTSFTRATSSGLPAIGRTIPTPMTTRGTERTWRATPRATISLICSLTIPETEWPRARASSSRTRGSRPTDRSAETCRASDARRTDSTRSSSRLTRRESGSIPIPGRTTRAVRLLSIRDTR